MDGLRIRISPSFVLRIYNRHDNPLNNKDITSSPGKIIEHYHEKSHKQNNLNSAHNNPSTELMNRDSEVKGHESAHIAAAGAYATSGPQYNYVQGPDGRNYAVGGRVGIDLSPIPGDPQATIAKAQAIRSAALAPGSPSAQDQRVAAAANRMEQAARQEIAAQKSDENKEDQTVEVQRGNFKLDSYVSAYYHPDDENNLGINVDVII